MVLSRFMAQSVIMVLLGYERSDGDNGEEVFVHVAFSPMPYIV